MSDFQWYSRLLVWAGCAGLLIQSITGRTFGFVTLVSVIFLVVGFVGFLSALALEGRSMAWIAALAEAPQAGVTPAPEQSESFRRPRADSRIVPEPQEPVVPKERVAPSNRDSPEPVPTPGVTSREKTPMVRSSGSRLESQSPTASGGRRVTTEELQADSGAIGAPCRRCERPFVTTDIVAMCWSCGSRHHAACWIENRFRCSTPGCRGAGSLDAPVMAGEGQ